MRCPECGADLPGEEACEGRFGSLLAAEVVNEELARLHGLTVLTHHPQHPSRTRPWYQMAGVTIMRRVFDRGDDWPEALAATLARVGGFDRERNRWRQVGARKGWEHALNERRVAAGREMPAWVITEPIPGEVTVGAVDPDAPFGQTRQVWAWARSVAEHRILGRAGPPTDERADAQAG